LWAPDQAELLDGALSCYAPSFASHGYTRHSGHGEVLGWYAAGWLWLPLMADKSGIQAWHRQQKLRHALDELDGRHGGESPLWLRWSHPGDVGALLASWSVYRRWWHRSGGAIDLVGVVDLTLKGQPHVHGYGYGERLNLEEHAEAWGRAGGYPFVYARAYRPGRGAPGAGGGSPIGAEARSYLVRKLRGYITAKQGSRRLRLRVER